MKQLQFTPPSTPIDEYNIALHNNLSGFCNAVAEENHKKKIISYVRDSSTAVVAGVLGEIKGDRLDIDDLWVSESVRRCGVGTRLLRLLEDYAEQHNIHRLELKTSSTQAMEFYKKNGYDVLYRPDPTQPDSKKFLLRKVV